MKKQKIPLALALGIGLVLISVSVLAVFQLRMHIGTQQSQRILTKITEVLPERTLGTPELYPDPGMPILEIDGVDYVALLEIPSFGVALPIADKWDGKKLFDSPARFYGSAYDHTLVIGGTDDPQQLGFCDKIEHGAIVTVTDMTGAQFVYRVSGINRAKHANAQWLTDADCDLTVFCHDMYTTEYIAVRCVWAYSENK